MLEECSREMTSHRYQHEMKINTNANRFLFRQARSEPECESNNKGKCHADNSQLWHFEANIFRNNCIL